MKTHNDERQKTDEVTTTSVKLEKVICLRNPGFFKCFSFCRLDNLAVFIISATRYELFYPQLGVKLCSMAGGGVSKNI